MAEHTSSGGSAARGHDHADLAGDIDTMTVNQLRGWLKDHGVTGTSGMRKEDLVKAAVKTMRSDQGTASPNIATGKKSTGPTKSTSSSATTHKTAGSTSSSATTHKTAGSTSTGTAAHKTSGSATGRKTDHATAGPRAEAGSGRAAETAWESGNDDVIDLLLSHHEQIKQLFGQVGRAHGEQKQAAWQQLKSLLVLHESIEQQLVHPLAARRVPDGEDVIESRLQEEQQATEDLTRLYEMGIDHPQFDDGLIELRDAVVEHAELEEDEEFGYLRENVPAEQLIALATAARAAERIANRPHADMPASGPQNGSPAAIADRIRGALRDSLK
ncbi:hemerythrin domain-containing protein [Catellatospora vulcania]|uniref:hemerythrin domain-containing protein n=1 Tax=Catellatospora vulcania TaxID=1460450 RepID=UPI001E63CC89|nr:hemerythrin domain-containing protein [Catellatospora vulcania]